MKKEKKTSIKKGTKYVCKVCGLSVTVDNVCGCAEAHPIICCGTEMVPKKKKVTKK